MYIKAIIFIFITRNFLWAKHLETFKRILGNSEVTGSNVLKDINGTGSVFNCIRNCQSYSNCWSTGYKTDGDICRLISSILDESAVDGPDLGWTYFTLTGTCANHNDEQKSFYYFGDVVKRTFNESQMMCNNRGSHPVNIENSEENDFILDIVTKRDERTWLGCSDELEEGKWVWLPSLMPLTFADWRPGKPDGGNYQNCAQMRKSGYTDYRWDDKSCDKLSSMICEKVIK